MLRSPSAVRSRPTPKRALEFAEAHKLTEGIEGKNEKERAASLRLELDVEYSALYEAEDALSDLEGARLDWDLARYQMRVMEAGPPNL